MFWEVIGLCEEKCVRLTLSYMHMENKARF